MAIGLRFMTSKVMDRVPVLDWKVGWEVSLILEALRECYPLTALDNLVVHLRQVVQFVQVDAEDHHGRPGQHRTDPQAGL